jgi:hypothetical protein
MKATSKTLLRKECETEASMIGGFANENNHNHRDVTHRPRMRNTLHYVRDKSVSGCVCTCPCGNSFEVCFEPLPKAQIRAILHRGQQISKARAMHYTMARRMTHKKLN